MDISIVTPIYHGNIFINDLLKSIEKNKGNIRRYEVELILVNDSPEIALAFDKEIAQNFQIKVIENKENLGIHESRIIGIKHAVGKYIIMLDQDDFLAEDAIKTQIDAIGKENAVIGNGYSEDESGIKTLLYKNMNQQQLVNNLAYYFYIGNIIASPGLCMIKKNKIPEKWMQTRLKINGADDWLIWVEYLASGNQFALNSNKIYIHNNVGSNLSNLDKQMLLSSSEALSMAKVFLADHTKLISVYQRRLKMRAEYLNKNKFRKLICYLKNIDIAWYLLLFKLR